MRLLALGLAATLVLPAAAAAAVPSEQLELRGTYAVLYAAPPGGAEEDVIALVKTPAGPVELTTQLAGVEPGARVAVDGVTRAHGEVAPAGVETLAAAPAEAPATGTRDVLVIRTTWGARRQPVTARMANAMLADLDPWYREVSYGALGFTGDVTPVVRIHDPGGCDDPMLIERRAKAAAKAAGYHLAAYDNLMAVIPNQYCKWGGLGYLGGPDQFTWVRGDQIAQDPLRVPVHELGHNLGLDHANGLHCAFGPENGDCSAQAYYDPFDAMGLGWDGVGHFSAIQKAQLGWLPDVATAADGESVTLAPIETATPAAGASRALRVKTTRRTYWVEYRDAGGVDAFAANAPSGVQIRIAEPATAAIDGPQLIDAHPGSSRWSVFDAVYDDMLDASLQRGQSYTDRWGEVTFSFDASAPAGAAVTVSLTPAPPPSPPSLTLPANRAVTRIGRVAFRWAPPAGGTPVTGYVLVVDGVTVATTGRSGRTATVSLTEGPHAWSMYSKDALGRLSAPSATRTVTVDRVPPGRFARLTPAAGALIRSPRPTFRWTASAGAARYLLKLDGRTIALPAARRAWRPSQALARGGHRWVVTAEDAAGNTWASSSRSFTIAAR